VVPQTPKIGYTCRELPLLRAALELRISCIRVPHCVFLLFVLSSVVQANAQAGTATSISISTQQAAAGATVALIVATVKAGSSAVTTGTVDFFDGSKPIGTAQLVQSAAAGFTPGTATLHKLLGPGTHSISAAFRHTKAYAASASGPQPVSVAGTISHTATLYPTATFSVSDVLTKITVADINGDGFPDIILPLLDQNDAVAIYLNDPTNPGHFSLNQTLKLTGFDALNAIVVDVDGDGLLDIVLASSDITNPGDSDLSAGFAAIFLQDPAHPGTFKAATYVRSTLVSAESMSVVDMDGDGLLDIVFTGNYYDIDDGISGNGVEIAYQSATARATFSLAPHSFVDYESSLTANVADMDGDGNPDVVFGGRPAQQPAAWRFSTSIPLNLTPSRLSQIFQAFRWRMRQPCTTWTETATPICCWAPCPAVCNSCETTLITRGNYWPRWRPRFSTHRWA
jgi:Bacterial Ig-like domain (group 3)/FG-GAP-like repeat